jgi:hypothetical protein
VFDPINVSLRLSLTITCVANKSSKPRPLNVVASAALP